MPSRVAESRPEAGIEAPHQHYSSNVRVPTYTERPVAQPAETEPPQRRALAPAEGWLPLLLIAIAVYSVVFPMMAVSAIAQSYILIWSAAAGLVAGLLIAKIERLPQVILHLAACLIGYWLSIWLISSIAVHIPWRTLVAEIGAALMDPAGSGNTTVVFLFYLSFLSFFLGYFGTWLIYHARLPWLVAFVYCSILLVNLNYARQDFSLFVATLLAALVLLIARIQLSSRLEQWKYEGLHTDRAWLRAITRRCMQIGTILALLALLLGWLLPILSQPAEGVTFWNELNNTWSAITQGRFSWPGSATGSQTGQAPTNFFGSQMTISGSVRLPSGEVLDYTNPGGSQGLTGALYLAGFTYDHFDGHTWTSLSTTNSLNYSAGASLPNMIATSYAPITTEVSIVHPPGGSMNYIFAPPEPESFDVATTVYGNPVVAAWTQQDPLRTGEHYTATSLVSTAPASALAQIPLPDDDPSAWKTDINYMTMQAFYLQVPNDLSLNVKQTMQQWTQGAKSAYGALQMLEAHLSNPAEFTYSIDNPPIPPNVDVVDWLLQTHSGYCTYYATAMTIMARLLGIPARIVNGFSQGHFDARRKMWVVDGSDAHSWVQAYFPDYGWINFDPTPGFASNGASNPPLGVSPAPTSHPAKSPPAPAHKNKGSQQETPSTRQGNQPLAASIMAERTVFIAGAIILVLCSFFITCLLLVRQRLYSLYGRSSHVAGMFWRVSSVAGWLGLSSHPAQTPYEYSRKLCRLVPEHAFPLWRLTELFVQERWAPLRPEQHEQAEQELQRLWPGLRRTMAGLLWARVIGRRARG